MPDNLYFETLADNSLQDFLRQKTINNPLKGTLLENYTYIHPKQKGQFGEMFVNKICKRLNYTVERPLNLSHDSIINGVKTEIKFSVMGGDTLIFNHIAKSKDYDRLIFACCYGNTIDIKYCSKETACTLIDTGVFKRQQNGKKGTNDDYMFVTKLPGWQAFIKQDFIKDLHEW